MIETRIDLKNCNCSKCDKPIEDGSRVFCTMHGHKDIFCYDCKKMTYARNMQNNGKSDYTVYHVEDGFGKLEVNNVTVDMLDNGIYELQQIKDKYSNIFYIKSMIGFEESATEFIRRIDSGSFIMEKGRGNLCLFFPEKRIIDIYDFYDNQESNDDVVYVFQKWSKTENVRYICISNGIYGMTAKKLMSYESRILDAKETDEFRLETMEDIKKFYISNAIGRYMAASLQKMTPAVMLDYCENRIQGQDLELKKAVYKIYHYVQAVALGKPFQAENWLLTSPSGTGKTEFFRTIRDLFREYNIPIPVVQIDLSQITETGFKGANVSTIPQRILSEKKASGGIGICFLDEADKKCIPSYGSRGTDYNAAIQSNLLTMLEGIESEVDVDGENQIFDSNRTMFVLIGSFQDLRDRKQKQMSTGKIGFSSENNDCDESEVFYEELTIEDIIDFGMQEELAGRIVSVINFHKLNKTEMAKLLRKKTEQIGQELGCEISLKPAAEKELVGLSFGNLGARYPMNIIRTLAQDAIADVFFDRGFNSSTDKIIIDSSEAAHVAKARRRKQEECAEL